MVAKAHPSSERTAPDSLTASRNGASAEGIEAIQRARALAAMTEIAAERGIANASVSQIVARAGISRRTFYAIFEDREACFLAALEDSVAQATERVHAEYNPNAKWHDRVRSVLVGGLAFLDERPNAGRLLVVEAFGAGPEARDRRDLIVARAVAFVEEGGRAEGKRTGLPPLTAEGIVGGALSIVHSHIVKRDPCPLVELTNPLMSMIVLPYLGSAAARRELTRATPAAGGSSDRPPGGNPLGALHMRLTYRTVCVLAAIAAHPRSSNRRLADSAGVVDQGQISKLLTRLEKLGLVVNDGGGARGEPNAWRLTPRGEEVQAALASRR